jgi:hypothetical protein
MVPIYFRYDVPRAGAESDACKGMMRRVLRSGDQGSAERHLEHHGMEAWPGAG